MINILKKLLDLIYDKKCYFCSKTTDDSEFCDNCFSKVEYLSLYPVFTIDGVNVYSATLYEDIPQKLIRAVKFHNKKELAKYQAQIMVNFWQNLDISKKKYTVIPTPMFFSKARKRNYNHMDLVAEHFSKLMNYNFDKKALIRNRETAPQYKLNRKQREDNLKDAFTLVKKIDEPVLILDDISTTGTTLREIISELKKFGIDDITCFVTAIPK